MLEQRNGVLVNPYERLSKDQIEDIHQASMKLLENIGIESYNENAADLFEKNGADVIQTGKFWKIKIPEELILEGIKKAPRTVVLGAREKKNRLVLDGREPRVRFGTGSECNSWLDTEFKTYVEKNGENEIMAPSFSLRKGTLEDLENSAHIAENLENLDFFIRNVNIQDDEITVDNKDANKFFASLNNTSKHVMAGLTNIDKLDEIIEMGEIIAGGEEEFKKNPVLSFITSMTKSPLQFVKDSTEEAIEMARRGLPNVISSAPQGGTTAPIQEGGIVAQINAELLAGVTMVQLANEGAPIIYGPVPVRTRMDDLGDMYGVPEFGHYNLDSVQMARYYGIPCYSTGGIADAKVPGIQATIEKFLSHIYVAQSGGQYMHCAIGLLGQNNIISPEQMILDNAQIGMVKYLLKTPEIDTQKSLEIIKKVMDSPYKLFTRYARSDFRKGKVYDVYPFATKDVADETLYRASLKKDEIMKITRNHLEEGIKGEILNSVRGII